MKSAKKILLLIVCVLALVTASVFGTLAYLTDSTTVLNTFTVGDVGIKLDETLVLPNGTAVDNDADGTPDRTEEGNEYHLIPGCEYTKDPTVTVLAGSEDSYIRMLLSINCLEELDAIFAPGGADLKAIFTGYSEQDWIYVGETRDETANTVTHEFRYAKTVGGYDDNGEEADVVLPALFTAFAAPGILDSDDLKALEDLEISVTGEAIQASGFDGADAAWAAFEAQMPRTTEVPPTAEPVATESPAFDPAAETA